MLGRAPATVDEHGDAVGAGPLRRRAQGPEQTRLQPAHAWILLVEDGDLVGEGAAGCARCPPATGAPVAGGGSGLGGVRRSRWRRRWRGPGTRGDGGGEVRRPAGE